MKSIRYGKALGLGLALATAPIATAANNTLSVAEQADGYTLLWNGKDFTGWKSYHTTTVSGTWSVVHSNGLEVSARKSVDADSNILEVNASGASMFTVDTSFQNFDYKVEWKMPVGLKGNSGMIVRYREAAGEYNGASGPEAQIINSLWVDEWKSLLTTAGCNYEMTPLLKSRKNADNSPSWVKPDGEWNEFRIIAYGGRVAHYGNGVRLLEYQMLSPEWNAALKDSKYSQYANYKTIHPGSIFLQNHGEKWSKFRNLRIKKLTQNPWSPDSPYLNKASGADSTLIDALASTTNLFPATPNAIGSNTINPDPARIETRAEGITILFARPGDYSLRIQDIRGATTAQGSVHGTDRAFVSGRFPDVRILSLFENGQRVQQNLVGGK